MKEVIDKKKVIRYLIRCLTINYKSRTGTFFFITVYQLRDCDERIGNTHFKTILILFQCVSLF